MTWWEGEGGVGIQLFQKYKFYKLAQQTMIKKIKCFYIFYLKSTAPSGGHFHLFADGEEA